MFPYIDTTGWHIGRFGFEPMTALIAIALGTGYLISLRRTQSRGIDREFFSKLGLYVIVAAFVGGHLGMLAHEPGAFDLLRSHPFIALNIFDGQASFGVFFGGFVAALMLLKRYKVPYRDCYIYADAVAFAVPFSCWLVRLGCYLSHDHPGIRTASFLGVRYPGGTRYDLGLLEMLFLLLLAGVFFILDRKKRPRGFYFVTLLVSYGIFRILLDSLLVQPARYAGWTLNQIAAAIMILIGAASLAGLYRLRAGVQ
jgi:phosphatidylglycerol---prolipoprotein diacylglyceryl transferase